MNYNRHILDGILSSELQSIYLPTLNSKCVSSGEIGKRILFILQDWWCTAKNELEATNILSPIQKGITLIEAENVIRKRDFGVGIQQKTVVEQIKDALAR